uniref:Uncharacterized protein n=1 Tax=Rhizophora mucronata TaxID=61149 RepID=A0A2P2QGB3_RHIMU
MLSFILFKESEPWLKGKGAP